MQQRPDGQSAMTIGTALIALGVLIVFFFCWYPTPTNSRRSA